MALRANCPRCKTSLTLSDEMRGQTVRCSSCQKEMRIPPRPAPASSNPPAASQQAVQVPPASAKVKPANPAAAPRPNPTPSAAPAKKPTAPRPKHSTSTSNLPILLIGGAVIGFCMVATVVGAVVVWATGVFESGKPTTTPVARAADPQPKPLEDQEPNAGQAVPKKSDTAAKKKGGPAVKPQPAADELAALPPTIAPDSIKKVKKATAHLKVKFNATQTAQGSGFFAIEPGIIITNAHVVGMLLPSSDKPVQVEVVVHSGQPEEYTVSATIMGVDRHNDLAVLRVQGEETRWPAPLEVAANLTHLVETQKVYIFGFPFGSKLGKEISVTESSIASFRNDSDGSLFQIQTNGGMHSGNSGGPVVDTRGVVVGVSVSVIRGTAINFAVPSEKIHGIVHGAVEDMRLGERFVQNQKILLPFQAEFRDPLQRVQDVTLEVWTGADGPPRRASNKPPTAQAGDGPRQAIALGYKKGFAKLDLALPTLPANQVYWLQATFTSQDGATRWGPAVSYKPSSDPPLERVPANLTLNTNTQQRTMTVINKSEDQLTEGKEKLVRGYVMEMQFLETLDKNAKDNAIKIELGNGSFYTISQGQKRQRNVQAQKDVRGSTFNFLADFGGRLTRFGFVSFTTKDEVRRLQADDMAGDIVTTYQAASLGMPNRNLVAQQTWQEKIRMVVGSGKTKDVLDLVLACTYEGSRTVNGKVEALISMTGNIKVIKSARPIQGDPIDKLTGTAVFNVTDGMISKYKLQMRAEYDMDGLMLTETLEIEFTRVPGNPYNIMPPAKASPAKILLQKSASLNANDPSNPKKEGTKQKIFQVNLTAGKQYVIEMNQPPGSKVDPYLRLEDLKGKILAEDDDSGGDLNARIEFTPPTTGVYRIVATSCDPGQLGTFNLVVTEFGDFKDEPPPAKGKTPPPKAKKTPVH